MAILTILEGVLADLSSSVEVFLRRDAGASGKLWFVSGLFWSGGLVSGGSRAECGGIHTILGGRLLPFVIESFGFKVILLVDVAPVMASCTALAESLVHASLGLGSVLDYGTGRERTFGASHDGRSGGVGVGVATVGVYIGEIMKALVTSVVDHKQLSAGATRNNQHNNRDHVQC